jgi:hypothetical protein
MPMMIAVIITAALVGGGIYWWQTTQPTTGETETIDETTAEPETESIISETQKIDFALSIEQNSTEYKGLGESIVTVKDTYNEGAGFSLHFPSSWGFVNVTKHNLTDSGGGNPPQRASYTFTSEFRPSTDYFTVIISFASEKDNSLVTQGNRIFIAEDETYYYNYNSSTEYCVEEGKCEQAEVEGINAYIKEIIDSFELL